MNWWQLSNIALVAVWKKAVGIGAGEAVGSKVRRQLLGSLGVLSMSHPFLLLLDPTINLYLLQKKRRQSDYPTWLPEKMEAMEGWRFNLKGALCWRQDWPASYGCRQTLGTCMRKHPTLEVSERQTVVRGHGEHWEVSYFMCAWGRGGEHMCTRANNLGVSWKPSRKIQLGWGRKRWRCTKY